MSNHAIQHAIDLAREAAAAHADTIADAQLRDICFAIIDDASAGGVLKQRAREQIAAWRAVWTRFKTVRASMLANNTPQVINLSDLGSPWTEADLL